MDWTLFYSFGESKVDCIEIIQSEWIVYRYPKLTTHVTASLHNLPYLQAIPIGETLRVGHRFGKSKIDYAYIFEDL